MRERAGASPRVLLLALGVSCGGDAPKPEAGCPDEGTVATWSNHGKPFVDTWCTSCHSVGLSSDQRHGAPPGVDFDTFQGVEAYADRIVARAVDTEAMPPVGGPSPEGRSLLGEWIACGLPGGEVTPPPPCDGARAVSPGDLVVQGAADLDTFCSQYDAVGGDLRVEGGAVTVDCLCDVAGSLVVGPAAAAVALPNLARVGGDLEVVGAQALTALDLPALAEVGGSVRLEGNPVLAALAIERVTGIGGELLVADNGLLPALWTDRLLTVGGAFRVADNATLEAMNLDRIVSVGGSLSIEDNPELTWLEGDAYGLKSVGGDLLIRRNPELEGFYGFVELVSVGGDLEIVDNDTYDGFFGFTRLESVGGHVWIRDNGRLGVIDGFDFLAELPGSLELGDNPELRFVSAFRVLESVGDDPADPELRLVDLPALEAMTGLDDVRLVGALRIERTGLPTLLALSGLQAVGADFTVVDNPALPTAEVNQLAGAATIGGAVTISGNAP